MSAVGRTSTEGIDALLLETRRPAGVRSAFLRHCRLFASAAMEGVDVEKKSDNAETERLEPSESKATEPAKSADNAKTHNVTIAEADTSAKDNEFANSIQTADAESDSDSSNDAHVQAPTLPSRRSLDPGTLPSRRSLDPGFGRRMNALDLSIPASVVDRSLRRRG